MGIKWMHAVLEAVTLQPLWGRRCVGALPLLLYVQTENSVLSIFWAYNDGENGPQEFLKFGDTAYHLST